ncbi:MAG: ATP-binding cassette domain-containing protein, partial [Candidatus Latescibacterota bacterium]
TFLTLSKSYDNGVIAVDDFDLAIPGPALVVIVGPSGCGKTTILRLVAGLEKPTQGEIHLGEARLDTVDPRKRDVAMVFQSYALYPHMTVGDNLSFGMRLRKMTKAAIRERVADVSRTLEIGHLLDRKPGELSGGQRQRVALGRAIIREPRVFLFDEPLSNLDARLRVEMRSTIKQLFQRLQVTTLYVTHDQVEAMTIGEILVIMNEGRIQQVGSPEECYEHPCNKFVATFLGSPSMGLLDGEMVPDSQEIRLCGGGNIELPQELINRLRQNGEKELWIGVRPENIYPDQSPGEPVALRLSGTLRLTEPLGHEALTHISVAGREIIARGKQCFTADGEGHTQVFIDPRQLHFFSRKSGERIEAQAKPGA